MKKHLSTMILWVLSLLIALPIFSQEGSTIFQTAYMQAPDGGEYISMEQEIWKPLHAQRVREGKIFAWLLYEIVFPGEGQPDYNYMTVEIFPNWSSLENPYAGMGKWVEEVHGSEDVDKMMERTNKARKMLGTDLWMRPHYIESEGYNISKLKYVVADFMDVTPGHNGTYMQMEQDYYMPMHQLRVDNGNILWWSLFSKMGYSEAPGSIDAITAAGYENWDALWNSMPDGAWETANPGASQGAVYERMRKQRTMTGSMVMRLVDYVVAEE